MKMAYGNAVMTGSHAKPASYRPNLHFNKFNRKNKYY